VRLGQHRDAVHERVERGRPEPRLVADGHERLVDVRRQLAHQAGLGIRIRLARGLVDDQLDGDQHRNGHSQRLAIARGVPGASTTGGFETVT